MIIPPAFAHVQHFFGGVGLPNGAAVTYGIAPLSEQTPASAAVQLHLLMSLHWLPQMCNTVTLEETRVKFGPNSTGPFASHVEPIDGGLSLSQLPPNTAILIEKRTAMGGRSGRGRAYLPGMPEVSVNNGGDIDGTTLTGWNTIADAWLSDINEDVGWMAILHNASSDPTIVTDLSVDPVAATQRRRLR